MSIRIALGGPAREAAERVVARLVRDRVASRITAQDPTVLPAGSAASLAWTEAVADSVPLLEQVRVLRHDLRHQHIDRAVVPDPTGATLAAAMIASTVGLEVDSDLSRLDRAVVVAIGGADGVAVDPDRLVTVGAPHLRSRSALTSRSKQVDVQGSLLTGADGALSAASLVPAGLAGADLQELLDEAQSESANLAVDDPVNNGLRLGAALAAAGAGLEIVADGTHVVGFPVWAARLVAEQGAEAGVALDGSGSPATAPLRVRLVADADAADPGDDVLLSGTLGELVLTWQYAVAVAAVLRP